MMILLLQNMRLSIIFVFSIAHNCANSEDIVGCPTNLPQSDRLVVFREKCYHFYHLEKTWDDARSTCHELRGDLVKVDHPDINNFIIAQIKDIGWRNNGVWIGLNDKKDDGSFRWESRGADEVAHWTNWASGHPSDLFVYWFKDCVYMDRGDNYRWHEDDCDSDKERFICTYDYTPPTTTTEIAQENRITPALQRERIVEKTNMWPAYLGLALGLILLLVLVVLFVLYMRRRRKQVERNASPTPPQMFSAHDNRLYEHDETMYSTPRAVEPPSNSLPPSYHTEADENTEASDLPSKVQT